MDSQGACYVSVIPDGSSPTDAPTGGQATATVSTDSTILRLAPGADAPLEVVATLVRQVASVVAVWPTSQPNRLDLLVESRPLVAVGAAFELSAASLLVTSAQS
jgi:hypothetical protein